VSDRRAALAVVPACCFTAFPFVMAWFAWQAAATTDRIPRA
jgi:TRAP-type C4-dicarboxylate transport system permease small subunit